MTSHGLARRSRTAASSGAAQPGARSLRTSCRLETVSAPSSMARSR